MASPSTSSTSNMAAFSVPNGNGLIEKMRLDAELNNKIIDIAVITILLLGSVILLGSALAAGYAIDTMALSTVGKVAVVGGLLGLTTLWLIGTTGLAVFGQLIREYNQDSIEYLKECQTKSPYMHHVAQQERDVV